MHLLHRRWHGKRHCLVSAIRAPQDPTGPSGANGQDNPND